MARPSRRGDTTSAAKTRKAGSAKGRAGANTKRTARLEALHSRDGVEGTPRAAGGYC